MAGLLRIYSGDFVGGPQSIQIPIDRGCYDGFYVTAKGVDGTKGASGGHIGNPLAKIWKCTLQKANEDMCSFQNVMMYLANQRWYGAPLTLGADDTDAAPYVMTWYIPASPDPTRLPNSFYSRQKGDLKLNFEAQPDVVAGNGTMVLQVYAVPSDVNPLFFPLYRQTYETALGTSTPTPLPVYSIPNPKELFIFPVDVTTPYAAIFNHAKSAAGYTYSSHIANLQINKDGKLWHNASLEASVGYGNLLDNVEVNEGAQGFDGLFTGSLILGATEPGVVHIRTENSPLFDGQMGNSIQVEVTCDATGANALFLYVGLLHLGDEAIEGKNFIDSQVGANLSRLTTNQQAAFVKGTAARKGLPIGQVQKTLKANNLPVIAS